MVLWDQASLCHDVAYQKHVVVPNPLISAHGKHWMAIHIRNYASMKECNDEASLHQLLGAMYQAVDPIMMGIYDQ